MYKDIIRLIKGKGYEVRKGLSMDELVLIESKYRMKFPESLAVFLEEGVPVGGGFYDWRDFSENNVEQIRNRLIWPIEGIMEDIDETIWQERFGCDLKKHGQVTEEAHRIFKRAPQLIPVYAHRYIPVTEDRNPPIISVYGTDIIYYGRSLYEYFEIEFGKKDQGELQEAPLPYIEFWSDIM